MTATLIRSIQRGTGTIASGTSTDDVTITRVSLANARLRWLWTSIAGGDSARGELLDNTTVRATAGSNTSADQTFTFEVIEEYRR